MKIQTLNDNPVNQDVILNYCGRLVNRFFKIIPMWEHHEASLPTYLDSLQIEMLGFRALVDDVEIGSAMLSLLSILQYMLDHPDMEFQVVRREVFRAISTCNFIQDVYKSRKETAAK